MIKEIKYSGYTTTPADYECIDGDLAASVNLINEDNSLRSIGIPKKLFKILNGKIEFVHYTSDTANIIILGNVTNNDTTSIYWVRQVDNQPDINANALPNEDWNGNGIPNGIVGEFNGFKKVIVVGNTLVVSTDNGIYYVLWRDDNYIKLGKRPPFVPIEFGLVKLYDTSNYSIDTPYGVGDNGNIVFVSGNDSPTDDDFEHAAGSVYNNFMAVFNKFVSESNKRNRFLFPFYIRYAFKFYDGTYAWHSSPVLMIPNVDAILPVDKIERTESGDKKGTKISGSYKYFSSCALRYRIRKNDETELYDLQLWSDIIVGIDIFITAPIAKYETLTANEGFNTNLFRKESDTPHLNGSYTDVVRENYLDWIDSTTPKRWNFGVKHSNISNAQNFYLIKSFKTDSIKAMMNFEELVVDENCEDLNNLVTHPTLPDDFNSHCDIITSNPLSYNNRLIIPIGSKTTMQPLPFVSMVSFHGTPTDIIAQSVIVTAYSKHNGTKTFALQDATNSDNCYDLTTYFPRFIYYADSTAYKLKLQQGDKTWILKLTSHDFLNGAYWFGGLNAEIDYTPDKDESTDSLKSVYSTMNTIYVSDATNPFVFPIANTVTVGNGRILGVSTAAKALSQGQFGQFPMYAFTTEGIWALELSSTGTFAAKQPITRDVCINAESITQIDSAVLFATNRGIILLQGSETICISDVVNSDYPFNVKSLQGINQKLLPTLFESLDIIPFLQYITDCGIIYDYHLQRIIIFNKKHKYNYIYSLKSKMWGMKHCDIVYSINAYPEAWAVDSNNNVLNFSLNTDESETSFFITRPLKLDMPDALKTIDTVIQRGNFKKGNVKCILYGSRDLYNWHIIWSSQDHFLRGFRGTPYKYFRIAAICDLNPDESIFSATIQYTQRQTNQLR